MKKILIPTDFSLKSYYIIKTVVKLFKNKECTFYLLHRFSYNINGLNAIDLLHAQEEWFEEPKQASEKNLKDLVNRCARVFKNEHRFYGLSECGSLFRAIKKKQEALGIDLIVLTRGASKQLDKKNRQIMNVVRNCPVLLMPINSNIDNNLSVTIASDFKQPIETNQLDQFRLGLGLQNVEIGILILANDKNVLESSNINLRKFIAYLKQFQSTKINLAYAKSKSELKDYASLHNNGIMCLVDEKPSIVRKLGLIKSSLFSILTQLKSNSILTIRQ